MMRLVERYYFLIGSSWMRGARSFVSPISDLDSRRISVFSPVRFLILSI